MLFWLSDLSQGFLRVSTEVPYNHSTDLVDLVLLFCSKFIQMVCSVPICVVLIPPVNHVLQKVC